MKKTWSSRAASVALAALALGGLTLAAPAEALAQASSDVRELTISAITDIPDDVISDGTASRTVEINIARCLDLVGSDSEMRFVWTFSALQPTGDYRIAYQRPDEDCATEALDDAEESCFTAVDPTQLGQTVTHFVDLSDLLLGLQRGDCLGNDDRTYKVHLIHTSQDNDSSDSVRHDETTFALELERPSGDFVPELDAGEGQIRVRWMPDPAYDDYRVYYTDNEDDFADSLPEELEGDLRSKTVEDVDTTEDMVSTTLSNGITLGREYFVMVVAVDNAGNAGELGNTVVSVVPQSTQDFWETYQAAGGVEAGGFCAAGGGAASAWWMLSLLALARRRRGGSR